MKFKLGEVLRDKITGYIGVVMGRTEYMTGCTHYGLLSPELTKDGKIAEYEWIDESRLELTKKQAVRREGPSRSGPEQNPARRMQ